MITESTTSADSKKSYILTFGMIEKLHDLSEKYGYGRTTDSVTSEQNWSNFEKTIPIAAFRYVMHVVAIVFRFVGNRR